MEKYSRIEFFDGSWTYFFSVCLMKQIYWTILNYSSRIEVLLMVKEKLWMYEGACGILYIPVFF